MKNTFFLLTVFTLLLLPISTFSQPHIMAPAPGMYGTPNWMGTKGTITMNSGKIENIRGMKYVNIIYDYTEISVDAYRKENEFLEKRKEPYKNEPGKFEKFKEDWFAARKKYFELGFETGFNELGKKEGIAGSNYTTNNTITLKVSTVYIATRSSDKLNCIPTMVSVECTFLDKNGKELLRYFIKNVGSQKDLNSSSKPEELGECYARAARLLLKDIKKRFTKLNDKDN